MRILSLLLIQFVSVIFSTICFSENPNCEIYVINKLQNLEQQDLYIRLIPISAIFNGHESINEKTHYTLISKNTQGFSRRGNGTLPNILFNVGLDGFALSNSNNFGYFKISPDPEEIAENKWLLIGHDNTQNSNLDGLISYGKYSLEIYTYLYDTTFVLISSPIIIDFLDFNYTKSGWNGCGDLWIRINSIDSLDISFQWMAPSGTSSAGDKIPLFGTGSPPYDGSIKVYKQYHRYDTVTNQWTGYNLNNEHPPSKGSSISDENYLIYPIDGRELPSPYTIPYHPNVGDIFGNVFVNNNISTKSILLDTITNITVKKKAFMLIDSGKTFNMITPSFGYNNLIVEDSASLTLYNNAKINVFNPNKLTLKSQSKLTLLGNSEIRIKNGSEFCNEGSFIRGRGKIIFEKGIYSVCPTVNDFIANDSTKIVLEDSAVVVLPDDYTLRLKGNTTSLIMNPGSKIMFGENSGIVCDSGAKLIANDAAFTSTDSTKKWNGISLKHRSQDTIKNCLISNAQYGINIFSKNDDEGIGVPYSTEISGCSFVNKSGYELNIAIYAANSNNFLIMNNTITSTNLTKGFAQGIYTEFCTGGNVNFIGNTINNTGNGITLVSSSPFVSQNVINGNQYSESGIFLDNSNGKFEYNIINDFYYSIYSMLSSPDLLKNIFNNSYTDNILLSYSSTPNLKPVMSGGNTYWLSGDNLIKGEPSNSGIYFEDESYPNMGFGYNRFTLSNNDFYISGTVPSNFDSYFDIRENYWGTLSPDTSKFNVSNSIGILYNPFDDNSSESRAVNNFTLYDIGFGLKDTVFYLEGDNPGMANELYLEAYQKENSGEFSEAIEIYIEIISDYKDSVYAVSSLSRLFNCHEKKNSTITEFNSLQNFYSDIFEDTTYSETQRNLSEDFIIKSKVKQNNIEGAVNDYNTIYTNNMNTAKGTHALINMEILSAGAGDNLSGSNEIENLGLKQNRINDILKSVINKKSDNLSIINKQPERFLLSQNYPNPFNPVTKITYSIPVSGNVTIKIFDITGREIKSLINEFRNAGSYEVEFDGSRLASGVYYYKLETNNFSEIKKMILIK